MPYISNVKAGNTLGGSTIDLLLAKQKLSVIIQLIPNQSNRSSIFPLLYSLVEVKRSVHFINKETLPDY
jgi:hypothetical protein